MQKPPEDDSRRFYMENGLVVFTDAYLISRGYCCKSGCRHCPYGFRKSGQKDDKTDVQKAV